ncbi:hypothetical protein BDU57DRAFT_540948 [Ampelomyces quisqualis]|uniref:Uncharacterized protein n=1 Tax=Ampelomyces quisqualis TaxID=50730 RepID=A0A6A5QFD7_AMPQU|nr:hypothetical protein BDU57DRAFT_540948 [Ampelomyces quisqualis]
MLLTYRALMSACLLTDILHPSQGFPLPDLVFKAPMDSLHITCFAMQFCSPKNGDNAVLFGFSARKRALETVVAAGVEANDIFGANVKKLEDLASKYEPDNLFSHVSK